MDEGFVEWAICQQSIEKEIVVKREEFVVHACEQVLRFSRVEKWSDLSEELKVQLGFNMGAMALGLDLSKNDGFLALANARLGVMSMNEFHQHIRRLVLENGVVVDDQKVARPF